MTDFKQTFFPEFCAIGRTKAKTDKAEEWQKLNDRLEEFNVDFCNQATDNFSDELLNTLIGLQADDLQARLSLLGMNVSHLSKPNRLSAYIIHLTDNYSLPQCYVEVQQNGSYTVKIGVPAPAEHEDETHDQETETKEPTSVDSDELLKKIEATVIAVMNARSNHDTSRVLPRVPAFKSAGPPKVVKRGWQEMESSARLAHQFSSTPRISRLASLLGNPKAPMQLEPQDKDVFGKLFRSGLDDEVNSLPFSNPALLPSTAISSEDEVKALLQHSVDHVGKKRKFKDADEFHRAMSIDMRKALDEGPNGSDKVWAYHKYTIFINNLRAARGWSAANDYHWALMEQCQDGEFDFFAGNHFDAQCNEKIQKYALSSPSTKNAKGSGHTRQSRQTTTECSFHGKCNHRTEDCSILKQDPSLKGKKGPHFRT